MKEFIEYVIKSFAERPQDVHVCEMSGENLSIFELRCDSGDLGRVIGKSGSTIGAVRSLLSVLAARQGRRAVLEVVE